MMEAWGDDQRAWGHGVVMEGEGEGEEDGEEEEDLEDACLGSKRRRPGSYGYYNRHPSSKHCLNKSAWSLEEDQLLIQVIPVPTPSPSPSPNPKPKPKPNPSPNYT